MVRAMGKALLRVLINAAALWVAAQLVPGIVWAGGPMALLVPALVFGAVNAFIRPVLLFFSAPAILLTLGLFTFVVNALMLMLTSWVAARLGVGFHVQGFLPALLGAVIVSVVSFVLSVVLKDKKRD
jgi:putative membrane protein